jgi:oligogalacturonide lyase
MHEAPPPVRRVSRRAILAAGLSPALFAAKGQDLPGEAKKFLDAATEFEILRVTSLDHNAWMPLASNRALTRKGDTLLFASDLSGTPQLYRHDFKLNKIRQLTEAAQLNTNSFTWTAADRSIIYIDGRKVLQTATARDRLITELPEDWAQLPRLTASDDGLTVIVSSSNGTKTRIASTGRAAATLEERDGDIGTLSLRPRRAGLSYMANGALRYIPLDTRKPVTLATAPGEVLSAYWTADGASLLYLLKPAGPGRLAEIREIVPEGNKDSLVAKTSQYGHFQRNGDATVFLGASASTASPYILVLLRSVKRELTICEHRASDPRLTRAVLSQSSTRMAFQTDRHGKMVIYAMAVERLIEQTEENT